MNAQKARPQPGGLGSQGANAGQADGDAKHTAIPSVDIEQARVFLRTLDPDAERFNFRTFPDKGRGAGRTYCGSLDEVATDLALDNGNGRGVFVVVNEGGQTADAITRVRAVWADFDDPEALSRLRAAPDLLRIEGDEPHIVVQSSRGKLHAYWRVDGLALRDFSGVQRAIAARFGSDGKVSDLPRVMRLPGFVHHKGAPFLTKSIRVLNTAPFPAPKILAAFPPASAPVAPLAGTLAEATEHATPQQVTELRSALAFMRADDRDVWIANGQRLKPLGEVGRGLWVDWAQTSDAWKPGDAHEWDTFKADRTGFRAVFAAAQTLGWVNPASRAAQLGAPAALPATNRRAMSFVRVDELIANPKPPAWLIRRFLERDSLAQVFGEPGVGKSFLAVEWAVCVATGTSFVGHKVMPGPVLFIAGEGGNGLGRRFQACAGAKDIDLAGAPLYVSTMASAMTDPAAVNELLGIVDAHTRNNGGELPVLVVIDTVARNFGPGDENSTQDMTAFIAACDALREQTGACVLLVHHSGHADKTRARGSIALKGALDWEYGLTRDPSGALRLQCTKAKDAEPPAPVALRLNSYDLGITDDEGEPVTSAVLSPTVLIAPAAEGIAGRGKHQTRALLLLAEGIAAAEREIAEQGGSPETVRLLVADWRAACRAEGIPANRFSEVVRKLSEQGRIRVEGDHVIPQDPGLADP